jgi:hypothetical protein
MIETSRRSFLFGLGTVLAAVTIPSEPFTAINYAEAQSIKDFTRSYFDIGIGKTKYNPNYKSVFVNVLREDTKILQLAAGPNGFSSWIAMPDNEIIIPPNSYLKIQADNDPRDLSISLCYLDADYKPWNELHSFDEYGKLINTQLTPMFLPKKEVVYKQSKWWQKFLDYR